MKLLGRETKELGQSIAGRLNPANYKINFRTSAKGEILGSNGGIDIEFKPNKQVSKTGETAATKSGKQVHKELAAERRLSDEWDNVNEPIKNSMGENIEVPTRVDLKTGEPVIRKGNQTANPDAVSYKSETILDDKPLGRNVLAKDRQEIIRFITAYEKRVGKLPKRIAIQRYNPKTGEPVKTDLYSPEEFLPKE